MHRNSFSSLLHASFGSCEIVEPFAEVFVPLIIAAGTNLKIIYYSGRNKSENNLGGALTPEKKFNSSEHLNLV